VIKGETRKYSNDAVNTPCGGISSLETLGGFYWQFLCCIHKYRIMFLKDELMCEYFPDIAMSRRDPSVFLQCVINIH